jgi:hypothetical protein
MIGAIVLWSQIDIGPDRAILLGFSFTPKYMSEPMTVSSCWIGFRPNEPKKKFPRFKTSRSPFAVEVFSPSKPAAPLIGPASNAKAANDFRFETAAPTFQPLIHNTTQ